MLLAQNTQTGNPLVSFAPLILIGLVFYFLLIRPQQRRARAQQQLMRSIEVGDEVVTSGGILGEVVEIDDDEGVITLEIAEGVQIHILRGGIGRKIETYEDDDSDDPEDSYDGGNAVSDDQPDQSKEL
jgi:preprotein translocase subunit YajC